MSSPLMVRAASGRYVQADKLAVLQAAAAFMVRDIGGAPLMESPNVVREFLRTALAPRDAEVFCLLTLDNQHRLIAFHEMFQGTIDGASVYPREVVKRALADNAAAVILAHNHPSGVAEPSRADELITLRLKDALALVEIRILDHLIVGGARVVSLAERGTI